MSVPAFLRPRCHLPSLDFWRVLHEVTRALKINGLDAFAQEFAKRASELEQDPDDSTDLLALVTEYVEIV